MRLVIEVDEVPLAFLRNMQAESDEAWAEDPEDGDGSLELKTSHMATGARIVGVLLPGTLYTLIEDLA